MNCTEFEVAVEQSLEARELPDWRSMSPEVREHAASCAGCRQFWETQRQLDAVIVAWKSVHASVNMVDSVLAGLARPVAALDFETDSAVDERSTMDAVGVVVRPVGVANSMTRTKTSRSSVLTVVMAVACLMIAAVFVGWMSGHEHRELARIRSMESMQLASKSINARSPQKSELSVDVSGTLTAVISDLKSEYREMASETTAIAREMVGAIPQTVDVATIPVADEIELKPISSEMGRMLKPIGNGVESALGFLWQALPSEMPAG